MQGDDAVVDEMTKQLVAVQLDVRELITEVRSFKEIKTELTATTVTANKAMQSTDSAHKRLDEINARQKFMITTFISCIFVMLAVIGTVLTITSK